MENKLEKTSLVNAELFQLFACPSCGSSLVWHNRNVRCGSCDSEFPIVNNIPRFITGALHENFAIQWKKFSDVQLDSVNGTTCSRDRLLEQSGLQPEDFAGKTILEVGCGAGRFTEILLSFGADVIAVDYSAAVEACANSNQVDRERGSLYNAQADVFSLPFKKRAFDMVIGYGMLQHTGDASRALRCLWEHVCPGGLLLVDRYQWSFRSTHPMKYLLRPLLKRMPPLMVLGLAEKTCSILVPIQRVIFPYLEGNDLRKFIRFLLNRSPNAVYPINLEIAGKLSSDIAFRWSVLDTFDMWAPKYDEPQIFSAWSRDIESLENGEIILCKSSGQGNVAVVRRNFE